MQVTVSVLCAGVNCKLLSLGLPIMHHVPHLAEPASAVVNADIGGGQDQSGCHPSSSCLQEP